MKKIRLIEKHHLGLGLPDEWIKNAQSGKWEIYNAARPFPCHKRIKGDYVVGVFYGMIDPTQEQAAEYRRRAEELDAAQIVFVTKEEVINWAAGYCIEHNINIADFEFKRLARSYLTHNSAGCSPS